MARQVRLDKDRPDKVLLGGEGLATEVQAWHEDERSGEPMRGQVRQAWLGGVLSEVGGVERTDNAGEAWRDRTERGLDRQREAGEERPG